jgi:hypothetical protein
MPIVGRGNFPVPKVLLPILRYFHDAQLLPVETLLCSATIFHVVILLLQLEAPTRSYYNHSNVPH